MGARKWENCRQRHNRITKAVVAAQDLGTLDGWAPVAGDPVRYREGYARTVDAYMACLENAIAP